MPARLLKSTWPLIGVVHLPALPSSPASSLSMAAVLERAEADAATLLGAGFDGLVVENFGDRPFFPESVEPHTGAATLIVSGTGTGQPADLERAACVRAAVPEARVFLGSGVSVANLPDSVNAAGGAIVGTSIKRDGHIEEPVDAARARELVARRD